MIGRGVYMAGVSIYHEEGIYRRRAYTTGERHITGRNIYNRNRTMVRLISHAVHAHRKMPMIEKQLRFCNIQDVDQKQEKRKKRNKKRKAAKLSIETFFFSLEIYSPVQ